MMKRTIAVLILMSLPIFASAQLKSQANGIDMRRVLQYGLNPVGLVSGSFLNPDKFHMTQSYSMAVSSLGGQALSQAMYLNTMSYQISDPLSFSLQWGYLLNQPFGGDKTLGLNSALSFNNGFFISGAQLKYNPTQNTELKLEFRQVPYNPYYNPYYNPFYFRDDRDQ